MILLTFHFKLKMRKCNDYNENIDNLRCSNHIVYEKCFALLNIKLRSFLMFSYAH